MNYFGHARLAATRSEDPHYVLGAMLPDWTGWLGDRPRRVDDGALLAGIRFHHASDAAFHAAPRFVALVRESTAFLRAAGLERGPARGSAHVGVELLLDGALAQDSPGRRAYEAALAAAPEASRALGWRRPDSAARFERIALRLAREAPEQRWIDPDSVAGAIASTLARRPRLRVPRAGRPALVAWTRGARDRVRRDALQLLAETEAALRHGRAA